MVTLPTRNQIKQGLQVSIETKENQGSGILPDGVVDEIFTSSNVHPYEIKVRLEDGQVGRVKNIGNDIGNNTTQVSESIFENLDKKEIPKNEDKYNEFQKMTQDIKELLFDSTGIDDRTKLSKTASVMLKDVTDQKMKVFLTALSSDVLERNEDWINYVALSLTDVPPMSWKDDQREIFENNLVAVSSKFKRLAAIHFENISENFVKPSYQVTVTHADGSKHHNVVSLKPKQKEEMKIIAKDVIKIMKKKGFTNKDMSALIAILSSIGK